ncbi:uncharacterized protein Ir75a [Calliphora vicina]|uniref:uncharacterized protein Ir75a n=1 Tax=Calliphora vicina TaxID=7373 RepID=UPI00325B110E
MLNSNIFSLIFYHFLNAKLACVVLFHCWNKETLYRFSILSSQLSFYAQYVNLNDTSALHNFGPRYMRYDRPQIAVFMDMNCNQTDEFIQENSQLRFFNYRYNWLIYDELSNFSRFYNTFKNVNLSADTQLAYVVPKQPQISSDSNKTSYINFDVYNNGWFIGGSINITTNYEIECNGTGCERTKYLSDLYKRSLYGNRESLRDVTMRAAVVVTRYDLNAPEQEIQEFLLKQQDFHIDPLSRLGIQIFRLLQDSLYTKVNYTYYDRWTDVDYTGGIVGALVNDTADLTTAPFFTTAGRFRFLTPIAPTGAFRSVCMFRTPRNSGIQGRVFIEPFSTKVWIMFGSILALAASFLWLTFFVEYHRMRPYIEFVPSLLTTCLISFGSACSQGSFLIPGSLGGRLGFISLLIICFLVNNYYTSVVVSTLLGSPVKSKIKTVGELADSNLEVGLEPLPYTYTYLNFSTLPDVRRFVKRKIESKKNFWYSAQDGIDKMREKPGFVFIFETSTGFNIIENQFNLHEICDLNEILFRTDTLLTTHLHKNSSYKEILRLKIMRILETGIQAKHRRLWVRTHLNCISNNFIINVGMEYAGPLFLLLMCGYLIVLIIFMLEIIWHRYAMSRKRMMIIEMQAEEIKFSQNMINFSLLNLILYNFLENHIKWLIVLNCWDVETQLQFTKMAMNESLFVQMWPINRLKLEGDLEGRILFHENPHVAVYFDMNCTKSPDILQKASEEKLFKQHFHWLIYDPSSDLWNFKEVFQHFHLAVDADVTLALPKPNLINSPKNSSYILYDIYNNGYNLGGKLNVTQDRELICSTTHCSLKQYLSSLYKRTKYEHRWYLRDLTMRVTTVVTYVPLTAPENEIFAHLNSIKDKHIDGVAKFGFQYSMILKENLECDFRYNFTNMWSRTEVAGGCIGAMGIDGSADLSSSPFLSTKNRLKYVQAMMPLGNFRQVCMFRTPHNAAIQGGVILKPFSIKVWIIFGAILVLIAFLLWLTFFVEFHKMKALMDFLPSLLTTCLISFGSACYQGSFLIPSSMGGRLAFITLSLLTFIIYNYYTSIVVAILLGSPVKSNIKTMGQLADSNLEVGLEPIPYTKMYLNVSPLPEIKRFKRNKIDSKRNPASVWMKVEDGLRRVREDPGFVFVIDSFSGNGLIENSYTDQEICDLNEVPLRPEQPLYQHLPRNSSYRKIVKLKQLRILESGIYNRHHRQWMTSRLNCYSSSSFLVQVGLEYTAPLFIMLAAAYVLVLILMMLEILWSKFEQKLRCRERKE